MILDKIKKRAITHMGKYHLFAFIIFLIISAAVTIANLGFTKEIVGDDAGVTYHYPETLFTLASNTWESYTFPGRSNVIATISLIHVSSVNLLNNLGITSIVIDRLYFCLFFLLSGLGMYFLIQHICGKIFEKQAKSLWLASITGGIFYILNNFTMILLSFPPTTYLYSYILLPWIFLMYLNDYHLIGHLWKKIVFAFAFLLLFSGNPANTIGIVAVILIYELFFRKENKIIRNWKNFSITLLLIIMLSSYIILPVLGYGGNPYGTVIGNDISITYNSINTSISNLFRFRGHPSQDTYIFSKFLESNKVIFANYLLLAISFLFLLKKRISRIEIYLLLVFVLTIFLAKAEHIPFSSVNKLIFAVVPFFEMFRAGYYKFIIYSVFSVSILLPISLLTIKSMKTESRFLMFFKNNATIFVLLLILFSAAPFFYGNVMTKIHKTKIPDTYHVIKNYFEKKKTDFSILSLPQTPTGMTMDWGNGNYYGSAGHPDMFLLNRPNSNNRWFVDSNPTSTQLSFYKNILLRSNIKYIFLHKDIPESYSFEVNVNGSPKGQTNYKLLDEQISADKDFSLIEENQYFKLYELSQNSFTPHFLIAKDVLVSDEKSISLLGIDAKNDWPQNSVIYFTEQNLGKETNLLSLTEQNIGIKESTVLEFKKISPTKYRLVAHNVSQKFPLVFNENFDKNWKVYNTTDSKVNADADKLLDQMTNYKILDGNENEQADAKELRNYIENNIISNLGKGENKKIVHNKWADDKDIAEYSENYKIDFISKNYKGTIQNENLADKSSFETWFKKPTISEANHLKVNGFANSWVIDPQKICVEGDKCIKNADGSYDIELVIEFWPQRLFYIGLFISGLTLLLCLGYTIYYFKLKNNQN